MSDVRARKSKNTVTQSNTLIEASYTMSLNEKRVLMIGISKINPTEMPKKNDNVQISVTSEEWIQFFPDDKNPWQSLRRASKKLLGRSVIFNPHKDISREANWFQHADYNRNEGRVEMVFTWAVRVHLGGFIDQFTKVDLLSVNKLNNLYAVRLYELLNQYSSTGWREMEILDFRVVMKCETAYKKISDLSRYVIDKAIAEVNSKTKWEVKYRFIKKESSRYTHIRFDFKVKEQIDMFVEASEKAPEVLLARKSKKPKATRDMTLSEELDDNSWAEGEWTDA